MAKSKLWISKEWHIQPSEIDKLVYYEYEEFIDEINSFNKEQEKRSKEEQKEYDSMKKSMPNINNMQSQIGKNMTLPKISIPNFK